MMRRRLKLENAAVRKEKSLMESDLFYLGHNVFSNDWLGEIHRELSEELNADWRKKLILIPRDHLKSTVFTCYYTVQTILRNPDARIMIGSSSIQIAKTFLRVVKKCLQHPKIIEYYGDQIGDKWSELEISVATRSNHNVKESTVVATGVDQSSVSQHFDLIILDDIVNRLNSQSPKGIQSVRDYFTDCQDLLDKKTGKILVIGTRWSAEDLYGYIIKELKGDKVDDFTVIQRAVIEDGDFIYPERFDSDILDQLQKTQDTFHFMCQYYNDPTMGNSSDFKKEYFQEYELLNPDLNYNCVITVDPAISEKKGSDKTGIVVSLVDCLGNIMIEETIKSYFTPDDLIKKIILIHDFYRDMPCIDNVTVACESVGFQRYILHSMKQEQKAMREKGTLKHEFSIQSLSHKGHGKIDRIRGLEPFYRSMRVFHKSGKCEPLEHELIWLKSIHPDVADAAAYAIELWVRPYPRVQEKKTAIGEWWDNMRSGLDTGKLNWYNRPSKSYM